MSARTSVRRLDAFLRAFAATGNQGLAAEQAGVSRWTIRNRRKADPGFDARWRSAKAESALRLAAGASNRPPGAWRQSGGVELVVQRARKRPPQVVRSLRVRWTPRAEERFLGKLRQCNNVRLACERAGMTLSSFEAHWRRWPGFRRRVAEARAFARRWLEARQAARRERSLDFLERADAIPPPTIGEALRMARRHRRGRAAANASSLRIIP